MDRKSKLDNVREVDPRRLPSLLALLREMDRVFGDKATEHRSLPPNQDRN